MKFIKQFENFESSFYHIATTQDIEKRLYNDFIITGKTLEKVISILDRYDLDYDSYDEDEDGNVQMFRVYTYGDSDETRYMISLLEDEWWYIEEITDGGSGRPDDKVYVCDQFEGLIKFIEDIIII